VTGRSLVRAGALIGLFCALSLVGIPARADDSLAALREHIQWTRYDDAFATAHGMLEQVIASDGEGSAAWAETVTRVVEVIYIEPVGIHGTPHSREWLEIVRRAVEVLEKERPDSAQLVQAGNQLGMSLIGHRRLDEARAVLEATQEMAHRIGDRHAEASAMAWLATCAKRSTDYPAADRLYTEAIDVLSHAFGEHDPHIGRVLLAQAEAKKWAREFEAARELVEQAVVLFEAAGSEAAPRLAAALRALTFSHTQTGRREEALVPARRSSEIMGAHFGEQHPYALLMTYGLIAALVDLDRHEEAVVHVNRVVRDCENAPGLKRFMAEMLGEGVIIWSSLGDFEQSISAGSRAIELLEDSGNPFDRALLGTVLSSLALEYLQLQDDRTAKEMLERALELQRGIHGADSHTVVTIAKVLCRLRVQRGDFTELPEICEVVERALGDVGNPEYAPQLHTFWITAARLKLAAGQRSEARALGQRTLEFLLEKLGPEDSVTIDAFIRLARLMSDLGELSVARDILQENVAITKRIFGSHNALYVRARHDLAQLGWKRGDTDSALTDAIAVSNVLASNVRGVIHALPEPLAEAWLASQKRPERIIFASLLREGAHQPRARHAAWDWTLQRRGLLLDELAARRRATYLASSADVQAAWERLTRARRRLAALWVTGQTGEARERAKALEHALDERNSAEDHLAQVSAPFRLELGEQRVNLEQIAVTIPDGFVLVEICRVRVEGKSRDVALILTSEGETLHVDLGASAEIDRIASEWLEALGATVGEREPAGLDSVQRTGRALRRTYWDPISRAIGDAKSVLLVPGGAAHRFHPGALPTEQGKFLIEEAPVIQLISSARDLLRFQSPSVSDRAEGALALGAPDFSVAAPLVATAKLESDRADGFRGQSTCISTGDRDWKALPGSERELRKVTQLLGKREEIQLWIGADASEERLRRELPGKRVLHLATHGFFVSEDECDVPRSTPLLRSGLVLAGANDPASGGADQDDGILTAEELVTLDLRGVELAVLSACEGGRGEVREGEGVHGLRRALEIGGVRSTVTGLWPASDRWTERWMTRFYESRLDGENLPGAARSASLHCLKRLRDSGQAPHPYLWSGFVTAGDWR